MNKALALILGQLILVAYQQLASRVAAPMPAGDWVIETTLHVMEMGETPIGFVASCQGNSYVVVRGTDTPVEWIDDARILLLPFAGIPGKMTAGDLSLFKQIIPQVLPHLKGNVYVTGHSLGAAVGQIIAAYLRRLGTMEVTCCTFCGPRCSDAPFAINALPDETYRVFNTEDLVPTLPYAPALYQHAGKPVALTFNHGDPVANHDLRNVLDALEDQLP